MSGTFIRSLLKILQHVGNGINLSNSRLTLSRVSVQLVNFFLPLQHRKKISFCVLGARLSRISKSSRHIGVAMMVRSGAK